MSNPAISIRLEKTPLVWKPGETISGIVSLRHHEPWTTSGVSVDLVWITAGKGNTDQETVVSEPLFRKGEDVPPMVERRFHFRAPIMPWTYQGRLLKINWVVRVKGRVQRRRVFEVEQRIVIHPAGEDFRDVAEEQA